MSAGAGPSNGEGALVARAREGDADAFTELVNRYDRRIFRLARHITENAEDAEDVLQETFLRAYEHLPGFQGHSKFYTWLARIAINQALMKLRRRRNDPSVSLDEPVDTGEDTVTREIAVWDNPEKRYSQEEIRGILAKAVETLPPILRSVFVLRDIDELSTEETAEALNLSVPAVKTRLLRARLRLREKLTRYFKRKVEDVFAHL
ncbi:MAG: sigma-70 family RNA polymerase sigma factor [Acidobacteria bacterium]|nr:sigma-70 family RNA polymerase sigma factor [Acidobacteriota bacterium]